MTAINTVLRRDCAAIISDTACYNIGGLVLEFRHKALQIGQLRAVLAMRGPMNALTVLTDELEVYSTFDRMVAESASLIASVLDGEQADLYLAGWSEVADRPAVYVFTTRADIGIAPNRWAESFNPIIVSPDVKPRDTGIRPMSRVEQFDIVGDGVKLVIGQRAQLHKLTAGGTPRHLVGGSVELTTVTRNGVERRVLHDFGDEIGEYISPQAAPLLAIGSAPIAGMNRQQRRAAEREAAKLTQPTHRKAA
jgi:hypothetical protein